MSFISYVRGGLANAHVEVSKHINTTSINRVIQDIGNSIGSAAPQISHYITTGYGDRAIQEKQRNVDNAAQGRAEAAKDACPRVETTATRPEAAPERAAGSHVEAGNIADSVGIIGERSSIDTVRREVAEVAEAVNENPTAFISSAEDTCKIEAQGAKLDSEPSNHSFADGARRLGKAAWDNPMLTAASVATGAGILAVAAPAVVTAPILGMAGAAGFTPAGIAASSIASAVHASIGNVAAGSIFATMQSAAAGGYGLATLTTAAQAAGGAVAGVGGVTAWLKGSGNPSAKPKTD
ncbi:hypothetical protein V8C37DRAFT_372647 [Trichoderma ceciliae]